MSEYTAVSYCQDGLNVQEFADLFDVPRNRVESFVENVASSGKRAGRSIYPFLPVAKLILAGNVEPEDIAKMISQMRPQDLPAALQKEFWSGQIARQKFEEAEGDLWRTTAVIDHYAQAFKALRQGILLFSDTIEAQTELTDKQRSILYDLSDGLLSNLHEALLKRFGDAVPES